MIKQKELMQDNQNYLFVKSFTAKKERLRLQCSVYLLKKYTQYKKIGTQNKINFVDGLITEMPECLVYALYVIFNSNLYDEYYSILNGSTQVNTTEAEVPPEESIKILKEAVHLYTDLRHPNLVEIIEDYEYNKFYVVVFKWTEGECLFGHWNFEKYKRDTTIKTPKEKFKQLCVNKKFSTIDVLFSFLTKKLKKDITTINFFHVFTLTGS